MNRIDLEQIEKRLNIQLPISYKKLVAPLLVARDRGSSQGWIWDDPKKIVEYNLYLRQEHEWPVYYFCVGEDGSGGQFLIDLREAESVVQRTEYENLSTLFPVEYHDAPAPLLLSDWYGVYIQNLVHGDIEIVDEEIPEPSLSPIAHVIHRVTLFIFITAILALVGVGITALVFIFRSVVIDFMPALFIIVGILVITGPLLLLIDRRRKPRDLDS